MTKRIHLISGPRNISTAFMYSWANRLDTKVIDEPLYAYYLKETDIKYHPGTAEIIQSLSSNWNYILENYIFCNVDESVYFIKNMAHHILHSDFAFLLQLENIFLIRSPTQLITSFAKVVETPTMEDIGLKREWELYDYLKLQGRDPIVVDSNNILREPRRILKVICERLDVAFSERMLSWKAGARVEDGVWAEYWYGNVWKSTGFTAPDNAIRIVPQRLLPLYDEAVIYYDRLKEASIS